MFLAPPFLIRVVFKRFWALQRNRLSVMSKAIRNVPILRSLRNVPCAAPGSFCAGSAATEAERSGSRVAELRTPSLGTAPRPYSPGLLIPLRHGWFFAGRHFFAPELPAAFVFFRLALSGRPGNSSHASVRPR